MDEQKALSKPCDNWLHPLDTSLDEEMDEEEQQILSKLLDRPIAKKFPPRFLALCLIARKFDLERTIELLQNNYTMRKSHGYAKWEKLPRFSSLKPDIIATFPMWFQPQLHSKQGWPIHIIRPAMWLPKNHKFEDIVSFLMFFWHIAMQARPLADHKEGFMLINDMSGMSMSNFDYKFARVVLESIQNNVPMRLEKILILNPPSIFSLIFSFAKMIMSKKMQERVQVVAANHQLRDYVNPEHLPRELGGSVEYSHQDFKLHLGEWAKSSDV